MFFLSWTIISILVMESGWFYSDETPGYCAMSVAGKAGSE